MKATTKRLFAMILAAAMAVATLTGCGGSGGGTQGGGSAASSGGADDGKTYTLSFATHLTETSVDGASLKYYLEQVTEATGGRQQFDMSFGGALVSATDSLTAVSSGLVDLAFVPEGFFETQMYPTFVATLPYMTTSEWVANKALTEMFNTYEPFQKMCDDANVHNVGVVCPSEVVIISNKEIKGIDDMKGLKIRAMGAVNEEMKTLGAAPVTMAASEVYEALERKTVDAATGLPITLSTNFKLQEVSKHFIFSGIGTYTTSSMYMNKDVWESLPADLQEAFATVYDSFVDVYSGDQFMATALQDSVQAVKDAGGSVDVLSEEQRQVWKDTLSGMYDNFVKSADSYGYNGQEILDKYQALVEKYQPDDISYQLY